MMAAGAAPNDGGSNVSHGPLKAELAMREPVVKSPEAPAYLSAEQLAELIQVSAKTITRWSLEDPTMPVFRRGRVVRFPTEAVLAWLRRQESRLARRAAQAQRKSSADAA
jgi:excisionase family DNA binding protein